MGWIFDDVGKLMIILAVCLIVFGPNRLPEVARQTGAFIAKVRQYAQDALDQLREETDLQDLNLPDLQVGSLRSQATQYVRNLMDVDGQMSDVRSTLDDLRNTPSDLHSAAGLSDIKSSFRLDANGTVTGEPDAAAVPDSLDGAAPPDGAAVPGAGVEPLPAGVALGTGDGLAAGASPTRFDVEAT